MMARKNDRDNGYPDDRPLRQARDEPPECAEFLRRATFCERVATTLPDPTQRDHFLDLASRWRWFAEEASSRKDRT